MSEQKREMTQERETAILEGAIRKFGARAQAIVAIEELSELQKELTKWLRGKGTVEGLMEGMADVSIMLNQLELIFGDPTEQEIRKLERLEKMVRGDMGDEEQAGRRWISVKDALPEGDDCDGVLVVVSGQYGSITFDHAIELAEYDAVEGEWILETYPQWENPGVTHWTPLPGIEA